MIAMILLGAKSCLLKCAYSVGTPATEGCKKPYGKPATQLEMCSANQQQKNVVDIIRDFLPRASR